MVPGSSLAPPVLPGITLGNRPLRISQGAALYRGWDRVHRCDVLVKVQTGEGDPDILARFRRDAALLVPLRHPGIAAVYQFSDGDPALAVTEDVSGRTLAALVRAHGGLDLKQAAQIIEEVAAALDSVHASGVAHRGVTPARILLPAVFFPLPPRPVKLTEFGVARVEDDPSAETLEYASPEQAQGGAGAEPAGGVYSDIYSDIYSLAAVAYFALTGRPPFPADGSDADSQRSVSHRQAFSEPPPLRLHRAELTPEIEGAVLRGLAKDPGARYASAGQLAAALRAATEAAFSDPQQAMLASQSRRTGVLAGGLAGAAVLLIGAVLLWKTGHLASAPLPPSSPRAVPGPAASIPPSPAVLPPLPLVLPPPVPAVSGPAPRTAQVLPRKRELRKTAPRQETLHKETPRLIARATPSVPTPARSVPQSVAAVPKSAPISAPPPSGSGYLLLFASQNVAPLGKPETVADIPAQALTVDGHAVPVPPPGGWLALPAGKHWVSYYPVGHSLFGPRLRLPITLAAGAHLRRQVVLPLAIDRPLTLVAESPATAPIPAAPLPAAPLPVGWYTVSGWAAVPPSRPTQKATLVQAAAQSVIVDGQPNPALARGQWAELTAGKHTITFQPVNSLGVGPKTWEIALDPLAHLNQQIPLPAVPVGWYTVSGWTAVPLSDPGQKPSLVRTSAQSVTVDGQPNLSLALGQWAQLPAGKHTVTFLPTHGVNAAPKTWDITLDPLAHLNQKIPLTLPPDANP